MFEKQLHKFVNPNLVITLNRRTAKASCDAEKIVKLIKQLRKQAKKSARCPDKKMNCCELMVKLKTMLIRQKCEWQCVGRLKETMTIAGEMKAILKFISQLACLLNNTANTGFQRPVPERPPSYEITCGLTDDTISNFHSQHMGDNTFDISGLFDNTDLISSISPCLMNTRQSQSGITISLSLDLDDDDDDDDDDSHHGNRRSRRRKASTTSHMRRCSSGRTESLDRSYRERSRDCVRKSGNKTNKRRRSVSQGPSHTINVNLSGDQAHKFPSKSSSHGKKQRYSQSCSSTPKKSVKKGQCRPSSETRSTRKAKKYTSSPKRKITISAQYDDEGPIIDESKEYQSKDEEDSESYNTSSDNFTGENEPQEREKNKEKKTCHAASPPKSQPRKGGKCMSPKTMKYPCKRQSSSSPKVSHRDSKQKSKSASSKKLSSKCKNKKGCKRLSDIEENGSQSKDLSVETDKMQSYKEQKGEADVCGDSDSELSPEGNSCSSSANCSENSKTDRGSTVVIKGKHKVHPKKTHHKENEDHASCPDKKNNFGQSLTSITSGESREPLISSREMKIDIDEIDCDDMKLCDCKTLHVHGCKCQICQRGKNNNLHYSPHGRLVSIGSSNRRTMMTICLEEEVRGAEFLHPCLSSTESTESTESTQSLESDKGECPKECLAVKGGNECPTQTTQIDEATSIEGLALHEERQSVTMTGIPYRELSGGSSVVKEKCPYESSVLSRGRSTLKKELYTDEESRRSPALSIGISMAKEEEICPALSRGSSTIIKEEELYPDEEPRRSLAHSRRSSSVKEDVMLPDDIHRESTAHSRRSSSVKEEIMSPDDIHRESTAHSRRSSSVKEEIMSPDDIHRESTAHSRRSSSVKEDVMLPDDIHIESTAHSRRSSSVKEDVMLPDDIHRESTAHSRRSPSVKEDAMSPDDMHRESTVEEDTDMWFETAKGRREFLEKWWKFLLLLFINLYILYILWCVITSPECLTCNSVVPNFFKQFITSAKRSVRLIHYSPAPV